MHEEIQSDPIIRRTEQREGPRGLSKLARETFYLYLRQMRRLARRRTMIAFSLVQPMIWLVLFGQMFSHVTQFPGAAVQFGSVSYLQFFLPSVILQSIMFGSGQSGVGMIQDIDSGFLDKLLTTPINRFSILLGRIFGDLTRLLIQAIIIILIGWGMGWVQEPRVVFYYGIPGIVGALCIGLLAAVTLAGLNIFIALTTKNTESTFTISNFLTFPLIFVSGSQLPLSLMPKWMQIIAHFNPLNYAVDGMRVLLNGPAAVVSEPGLSAGMAVLQAVVLLTVLSVITVTLATNSFRRMVS
jgi:ABC-2 type transport system permease protein